MRTRCGWATVVLVLSLCLGAQAQQGTPQDQNATQQANQTTLTGTIQGIELQERGQTPGREGRGIHLLLQTEQGRDLNVHLGPQAAVSDMIQGLTVGQQVTVEAFRSDQFPEDQYVARSLTWDGREVELRDADLRPVWAGQQPARGRARGMMQGRAGGPPADGRRPMRRQQMQGQMQEWLEQMREASDRLDELVQTMNEAEGEDRVQAIADVVNELAQQHRVVMQRHQQMMERMLEDGPPRGMGPGMMRGGPPAQTQGQEPADQTDDTE